MDTSDWLELGAGFGMGMAMSRAIGNSFANTVDTQTNIHILNIPQTRGEIQTLLDMLDVRLAGGEISEATWLQVTNKWQARLQNS